MTNDASRVLMHEAVEYIEQFTHLQPHISSLASKCKTLI